MLSRVVIAVLAAVCALAAVAEARPRPRHPTRARPAGVAVQIFGVAAGGALQTEGGSQRSRDLAADAGAGARWLRIDVNWAQIEPVGPRRDRWGSLDATVRAAARRHLQVLGVLLYSPPWARPAGTTPSYAPDPVQFGAFAGRAARHLARLGVHAYEVWNEPNWAPFFRPAPDPAAYVAMLRAAYPAIHRADRRATVVTGGTAPASTSNGSFAPADFLARVYAAGGGGFFDAVGHHPYCWPAVPGARKAWSAWYQMYGTRQSLRGVMVAHGDGGKRIWATEFGAPTWGPRGTFVSEAFQAASVTRAYALWSRYAWAGPLFLFQGRDQGTDASNWEDFLGLLRFDGSAKPAYMAYRRAAVGFAARASAASTGTRRRSRRATVASSSSTAGARHSSRVA